MAEEPELRSSWETILPDGDAARAGRRQAGRATFSAEWDRTPHVPGHPEETAGSSYYPNNKLPKSIQAMEGLLLFLLRSRRVRNILMSLNYVPTANKISPASRMLKTHTSSFCWQLWTHSWGQEQGTGPEGPGQASDVFRQTGLPSPLLLELPFSQSKGNGLEPERQGWDWTGLVQFLRQGLTLQPRLAWN